MQQFTNAFNAVSDFVSQTRDPLFLINLKYLFKTKGDYTRIYFEFVQFLIRNY